MRSFAARAATRHAADIARHGFTAHIGTDGSVPELRYTEAGGTGLVMENVGCFADATSRPLDPSGRPPPKRRRRGLPHHSAAVPALYRRAPRRRC